MTKTKSLLSALALLATFHLGGPAQADSDVIIVQSTTSTMNSGLYDHLLPIFQKKTGIEVRVVAVGTGQALKNAENGDGDVLLVHSKADEEKFVAEGHGVERFDLMYNEFVIVGPANDPAKVAGAKDAGDALKNIAAAKSRFASRGDNSGTHKKEQRLWAEVDIDPTPQSGLWYRELGSGMGATLNAAVMMNAYALTDRGTWISFKNKGQHRVLLEDDKSLFNQYGIVLVNPKEHAHVRAKNGQAFIDWMVSLEGQAAIADYKLDGKQLFFPNAGSGNS